MERIGVSDYDHTEAHKLKASDGTIHAIASETKDDKGLQPFENTFPRY